METCMICGADMQGRRADAKTCSTLCRKHLQRLREGRHIPTAMKQACRWVAWRPSMRGNRVTKIPMVPYSSNCASSTNPSTWVDWATIKDFKRRGFVLGEGIGCIDIDDCIVDGAMKPNVAAYVDTLREFAVLVEVSPSGRGVHVFMPMEPGPGRVFVQDGYKVELYPPDSGRFICVTGVPC